MRRLWATLAIVCLCAPMAAVAEDAHVRKPGEYPPTADSQVQNVPHGQLIGPIEFHSQIIAGTVRRLSLIHI